MSIGDFCLNVENRSKINAFLLAFDLWQEVILDLSYVPVWILQVRIWKKWVNIRKLHFLSWQQGLYLTSSVDNFEKKVQEIAHQRIVLVAMNVIQSHIHWHRLAWDLSRELDACVLNKHFQHWKWSIAVGQMFKRALSSSRDPFCFPCTENRPFHWIKMPDAFSVCVLDKFPLSEQQDGGWC